MLLFNERRWSDGLKSTIPVFWRQVVGWRCCLEAFWQSENVRRAVLRIGSHTSGASRGAAFAAYAAAYADAADAAYDAGSAAYAAAGDAAYAAAADAYSAADSAAYAHAKAAQIKMIAEIGNPFKKGKKNE